jgi:hypothetical protein
MTLFWALLFGAMFSLQLLLSASTAEAFSHKTLQDAPEKAKRAAECAKGDTKQVKQVISRTIKHAKEKYKLTDELLNDVEDTKRAEKEMYDFLNWRMGSPSAVCGQYATAGQKHFDKGYSDEAAASLLGMELPGAGRSLKLPKRVSKQLKAQIESCADQVKKAVAGGAPTSPVAASAEPASKSTKDKLTDKITAPAMEKVSGACQAQVAKLREELDKYSIPPELQDAAIKKIGEASVAGTKAVDRIGFEMHKDMLKRWDVKTSTVEELMAKRREDKAAR